MNNLLNGYFVKYSVSAVRIPPSLQNYVRIEKHIITSNVLEIGTV